MPKLVPIDQPKEQGDPIATPFTPITTSHFNFEMPIYFLSMQLFLNDIIFEPKVSHVHNHE
jgi:hypothetical protein